MTGNVQPTAAIDRDKQQEQKQPQKTEQKADAGESFRDVFLRKWEAIR
ncbi:MAG: hypothetical protein II264_10915 [Ruminococcus sp.]|nr:hypothetical protein [Ruminococcus sp.]